MQIKELEQTLGFTPAYNEYMDQTITAGYTSDLLSDVMGNAPDQSVLITIQGHKNTLAVATLAGIRAIVLCNGRQAPEDMITAAKEEDVAIFSTKENQFITSAKIAGLLES